MATALRGVSGMITFGLVNVPIRTYGAVKTHGVTFSSIHLTCMNRMAQGKSHCPACGIVPEEHEVGKGVLVAKDTYVQITDSDIESLPLRTTKAIEVIAVVDANEFHPVMIERLDWVGPDEKAKTGQKAFVLFRDALTRNGKVAVAKTAKSGKEMLCILRPRGKALEMCRLYWRDEIVDIAGVEAGIEDIQLSDQERTLADQLLGSLDGDLNTVLSEQKDAYQEALEALLAAKAEGREPVKVERAPQVATNDLLAMLQASIKAVS